MPNYRARMIRLAAVAAGSYPDIIKLIHQDVNPIAAYCAVGATTVGLAGDLEDSTNPSLTEQERHDASRDAGRKTALLIADIAVAIAYNAAVDAESFGAGAAATGNIIGLERTANALAARFANALGLPEFQQKIGFGDGKPYQNITDIPSDAVMSIGGYDFLIKATKYRAYLERKFEERTGLHINDALIVGRLGLRLAEAGLTLASGEIPDLSKVEKHTLSLAQKFGLNVKGQDFQMIAGLAHGSISVANHIRQGKFGAKDVNLIAKMAVSFARRARQHGITPQFAQDAEAIANVVASTSNLVNNFIKGEVDADSFEAVLSSSRLAVARLYKRGALLKKNVKDLSKTLHELWISHRTEDGNLDIHKILKVTKQIVDKGIAQELVSKKSQQKMARAFKMAAKLPAKILVSAKNMTFKRRRK